MLCNIEAALSALITPYDTCSDTQLLPKSILLSGALSALLLFAPHHCPVFVALPQVTAAAASDAGLHQLRIRRGSARICYHQPCTVVRLETVTIPHALALRMTVAPAYDRYRTHFQAHTLKSLSGSDVCQTMAVPGRHHHTILCKSAPSKTTASQNGMQINRS
jgi:hypothetical protein